ncbi:MAG TPA: hypothetical protein V6D23_17970 [Candidatus Obscuribacterales bacterium]
MSDPHPMIRIEGRLGALIQYCPDCRRISLRYGNILMPLSLERFAEFTGFLTDACERHFSRQDEGELRLRFSDLSLCFAPDEAQALLDLTRQAETEVHRHLLEETYLRK